MTDNNDDQEEELFPEKIRQIGFWISLVFSLAIVIYYVAFIFECVSPTPKDLGLSNLLLFSAACFLFFAVPWHKLGLNLKKFGPLEFEQKLEGQSEEHVKDISALENKIAQLEAAMKASGCEVKTAEVQPTSDENEMRDLIVNFLTEYEHWSFSPLRMETWGAKRPGYSKLASNSSLLRRLLRSLVSEGVLETRVSKKGNTLYCVSS
ncbi:MAG: hypothetical protein N0C88_17260 [Candidatus Thiodiazotropha lotti]|uniref:Uncharacterized protein n=1 Tax=Candidatus Thiodiazotropha lotti TaxID=2792787 RepID=A0A9E4N2F9_9GAMM|nr:hypothetical protein [Candidatus Thiodiazotropha lotti]MCW4205052.1 hypothetical protein [Candidatus Thiodiazotropha lotti]